MGWKKKLKKAMKKVTSSAVKAAIAPVKLSTKVAAVALKPVAKPAAKVVAPAAKVAAKVVGAAAKTVGAVLKPVTKNVKVVDKAVSAVLKPVDKALTQATGEVMKSFAGLKEYEPLTKEFGRVAAPLNTLTKDVNTLATIAAFLPGGAALKGLQTVAAMLGKVNMVVQLAAGGPAGVVQTALLQAAHMGLRELAGQFALGRKALEVADSAKDGWDKALGDAQAKSRELVSAGVGKVADAFASQPIQPLTMLPLPRGQFDVGVSNTPALGNPLGGDRLSIDLFGTLSDAAGVGEGFVTINGKLQTIDFRNLAERLNSSPQYADKTFAIARANDSGTALKLTASGTASHRVLSAADAVAGRLGAAGIAFDAVGVLDDAYDAWRSSGAVAGLSTLTVGVGDMAMEGGVGLGTAAAVGGLLALTPVGAPVVAVGTGLASLAGSLGYGLLSDSVNGEKFKTDLSAALADRVRQVGQTLSEMVTTLGRATAGDAAAVSGYLNPTAAPSLLWSDYAGLSNTTATGSADRSLAPSSGALVHTRNN